MDPQEELPLDPPPATPQAEAQATPEPPAAEETPLQTLARLAEAAKARRLPPAEEERAAALLREPLAGGKAGIASVLELLATLPWIVCVNALTEAWPQWSVPMRRHLLASLAKLEGEGALRLRLSLARGLFKSEPAAALKLAAAVAADLRDPESGAFPPRHRQLFANVLIGKGKPWLLQLPLGELKGAEAEALAHAAVEGGLLSPPLSQLSILRWLHGAARLKKLSEADLAALAKTVSRWNGKLQRQLKTEIPELPEAISAVLKPEAELRPESKPERRPEPAAAPERAPKAKAQEPAAEAEEAAPPAPQEERPRRGDKEPRKPAEERPARPAPPTRGEREREPEKGRGKPFDFKETLRSLEGYVGTLRTELEQARTQLRRREDEGRRGRTRGEEKPAVDTEALVRHNRQLEETVAELRRQLEEIASHDEAVAESRLLHSEAPLPEGSAEQLRSLLFIRLKESHETYTAMRLEPLDRVFRLDYRDLLGSVFDVLLQEGVPLSEPKPSQS